MGTKCGKTEQNALPFSPAVELCGTLYFSGQMGLVDGQLSGTTIGAQAEATIDNIERLLKHEGLSLRHVFKVTAWISRRADFAEFNAVYRKRFTPPYPARSTVVSELVVEGALVEIEVIARR
ncbi:MAG: RidA family protein [Sinobacteraceae bacterium]|nr:RidA family protein [Nevskiaceae bacterium]